MKRQNASWHFPVFLHRKESCRNGPMFAPDGQQAMARRYRQCSRRGRAGDRLTAPEPRRNLSGRDDTGKDGLETHTAPLPLAQGRPAPVQAVAVARFIGGQIEAAAGQLRIKKLAGLFGQLVAFQRAQAFVIQFRVALLQQSFFFVVRHGCTGRDGAGACGETISGRKVMRGRPRPSSAPRTRCSNSSLPMTGPSSWPSSVTWASSRAGP